MQKPGLEILYCPPVGIGCPAFLTVAHFRHKLAAFRALMNKDLHDVIISIYCSKFKLFLLFFWVFQIITFSFYSRGAS